MANIPDFTFCIDIDDMNANGNGKHRKFLK